MPPYKTTADQVRTGHIIRVPWDGYRQSLEVEYTVRGRRTNAAGETLDCVWFTGWTGDGVRVERGWPQRPSVRVLVVTDLGDQACAWKTVWPARPEQTPRPSTTK